MHKSNQEVYNAFHTKLKTGGLTTRLRQYIQDCCLFSNEPIDWYYVRSQTKSIKETDQVCSDLIKYLNLTIEKNGEDYIPNMEV